jgi:cysteine synthase
VPATGPPSFFSLANECGRSAWVVHTKVSSILSVIRRWSGSIVWPQGVNLFVKIEAFNPLGSVKDRLALGVIEAARADKRNTGIGLATVCAAKGYPLVITMAEPFSVERRKLMRFLGAKVIVTPAAERGMGMVKKTIELAKAHGWFMTRQFENEANPDIHSRTTAREILDDFSPDNGWTIGSLAMARAEH